MKKVKIMKIQKFGNRIIGFLAENKKRWLSDIKKAGSFNNDEANSFLTIKKTDENYTYFLIIYYQ